MRSAAEIAFRLRQETANLALFVRPPRPREIPEPSLALPALSGVLERLRDTDFAREVVRLADLAMNGRLHLLGYEIETGPRIDWRRDYVNGISSGTAYFRFDPVISILRVRETTRWSGSLTGTST